ncbi:hypothetical protein GPJ56_000606 [Histomonas meleagridis]|uniref:uncharacterized protein n=1 Tax=Histomonas meleagridis TaxID=135588 RepID=UPI00355A5731|nr:hypothetical protein GPJ56_000606 [Histomonas meleagridis]KAH0804734.1 hypothetical protein GO595_002428 [Histomonas meleagridis]
MTSTDEERIQKIRTQIFGEKPDPKMKFAVKVWRILQYTSNSPEDVGIVGASWCKDGVHFIAHTQILANFLALKPNSINTNFRKHYFKIEESNFYEIIEEFKAVQLPDTKNWNKRVNCQFNFTKDSTEQEIMSIPICNNIPKIVEIKPKNSLLPPNTLTLLFDNDDMQRDVQNLFSKVYGMSESWKIQFLVRATDEWLIFSSSNLEVDFKQFIQAVIEKTRDFKQTINWEVLEPNIVDLLLGSNGLSQRSDKVTFLDFLSFELRFGFLDQIAASVNEICDKSDTSDGFSEFGDTFPTSQLSQNSYFDQYFFQQSQHPCFAIWFFPSNDQNMSVSYMKEKNLNWLLRMASTHPNCFTIQVMKQDEIGDEGLIATYIMVDPLADENERLLAETSQGSYTKARNWKQMISECLNLQFPVMAGRPLERKSMKRVPADIVANNEAEKKKPAVFDLGF